MFLGYVNVVNGNIYVKNFFELEFDGGFDFGDFGGEIIVVGDGGREFVSYIWKKLVFVSYFDWEDSIIYFWRDWDLIDGEFVWWGCWK